MRWFKHFTDNHRGRSIQDLLDQLGHTGLCFYLLQEMCAEKLEKPDETLAEADCLFSFHTRVVRQNLRISPANLRRLLDVCAANGLLSFEFSGSSLQIKMPILLKLLDRDLKNARQQRAKDAAKARLDKDKDKDKEEDKDKDLHKKTKKPGSKKLTHADASQIGQALISTYCDAWKARYNSKTYPPIRPQDAKSLKSFGEQNGLLKTQDLITAFLNMPDSFFVMKRHDLATFLNNTAAVAQFLDSGKMLTRGDLKDLEQKVNNQSIRDAIKRGEV